MISMLPRSVPEAFQPSKAVSLLLVPPEGLMTAVLLFAISSS
jgi:hypothetical protein